MLILLLVDPMGILLGLNTCVFEGQDDVWAPKCSARQNHQRQASSSAPPKRRSQVTPEGRLREERFDSIRNWVKTAAWW
jgi:hypothetical protein